MRLSLTLSPKQYKCLKSAADLEGKTLSSYILERALAATVTAAPGEAGIEALSGRGDEQPVCSGRAGKSIEEIFNDTMGSAER